MSTLRLWWPRTAEQLATHRPTRAEWEAELASGWSGSDGSSCSLDNIEGIEVGRVSQEYLPELPANHHDYDYRVLRRLLAHHRIDEATRRRMQAAADAKHYGGLVQAVSVLVSWNGWKARRRAGLRYQATRWFGGRHTLPSSAEAYRIEEEPEAA